MEGSLRILVNHKLRPHIILNELENRVVEKNIRYMKGDSSTFVTTDNAGMFSNYSLFDVDNDFGVSTRDILIKCLHLLEENYLLRNVNPIPSIVKSSCASDELRLCDNTNVIWKFKSTVCNNNHISNGIDYKYSTDPRSFEQEVKQKPFLSDHSRLVGESLYDNVAKQNSVKMTDATLSNGIESISCYKLWTDFHKRNDIQILIESLNLHSGEIRQSEIPISKIRKGISPIEYHSLKKNSTNSFNIKNELELIDNEDKSLKSHTLLKKIPEFHPDLNPLSSAYRKNYDERQLPLVGIDYKCRRSKVHEIQFSGNYKDFKAKIIGNNSKYTFAQKSLKQSKKIISNMSDKRRREVDEIQRYQQLIHADKELILSKSKYSKRSVWAEHLKEPIKNRCCKNPSGFTNLSSSVCNLGITPEIDIRTIEKYIKTTDDLQGKRPNNRDEIRRRLSKGTEDDYLNNIINSIYDRPREFIIMNEILSDNKSQCSGSEKCSKLLEPIKQDTSVLSSVWVDKAEFDYQYFGRSDSRNAINGMTVLLHPSTNEDKNGDLTNADFVTKQARLQIEARIALTHAKGSACIQMKANKQRQCFSPITDVIRSSLQKIGVQISSEKRRVSRQMLTDMHIAQLQILVNDLHNQIEYFNDILVHYLMERDEMHMEQDSMILDIEELTRYLGDKHSLK